MKHLIRALRARLHSLDIICGRCGREITVLPCVFCNWAGRGR